MHTEKKKQDAGHSIHPVYCKINMSNKVCYSEHAAYRHSVQIWLVLVSLEDFLAGFVTVYTVLM